MSSADVAAAEAAADPGPRTPTKIALRNIVFNGGADALCAAARQLCVAVAGAAPSYVFVPPLAAAGVRGRACLVQLPSLDAADAVVDAVARCDPVVAATFGFDTQDPTSMPFAVIAPFQPVLEPPASQPLAAEIDRATAQAIEALILSQDPPPSHQEPVSNPQPTSNSSNDADRNHSKSVSSHEKSIATSNTQKSAPITVRKGASVATAVLARVASILDDNVAFESIEHKYSETRKDSSKSAKNDSKANGGNGPNKKLPTTTTTISKTDKSNGIKKSTKTSATKKIEKLSIPASALQSSGSRSPPITAMTTTPSSSAALKGNKISKKEKPLDIPKPVPRTPWVEKKVAPFDMSKIAAAEKESSSTKESIPTPSKLFGAEKKAKTIASAVVPVQLRSSSFVIGNKNQVKLQGKTTSKVTAQQTNSESKAKSASISSTTTTSASTGKATSTSNNTVDMVRTDSNRSTNASKAPSSSPKATNNSPKQKVKIVSAPKSHASPDASTKKAHTAPIPTHTSSSSVKPETKHPENSKKKAKDGVTSTTSGKSSSPKSRPNVSATTNKQGSPSNSKSDPITSSDSVVNKSTGSSTKEKPKPTATNVKKSTKDTTKPVSKPNATTASKSDQGQKQKVATKTTSKSQTTKSTTKVASKPNSKTVSKSESTITSGKILSPKEHNNDQSPNLPTNKSENLKPTKSTKPGASSEKSIAPGVRKITIYSRPVS